MRPVLVDKNENRVETLGQRLRKEGRLQIDHLQRFGADLLDVLNYLQEQGIAHRDIKPDNIAVGMVGRGDTLHVVLFDFSLARTPTENIRAGTTGYLDPLLSLRKPPRWDLHAERYAAAATLYELATGTLPRWGDGTTDPSAPHLRNHHRRGAVRRQPARAAHRVLPQGVPPRRHPAVRQRRGDARANGGIASRTSTSPAPSPTTKTRRRCGNCSPSATFDTQIHELGLGTRATNALDRANLLTVEDLLTVPMRRLLRLRGVGNKTRREIVAAVRLLRERLRAAAGVASRHHTELSISTSRQPAEPLDPGSLSLDRLAQKLLPRAQGGRFRQLAGDDRRAARSRMPTSRSRGRARPMSPSSRR